MSIYSTSAYHTHHVYVKYVKTLLFLQRSLAIKRNFQRKISYQAGWPGKLQL